MTATTSFAITLFSVYINDQFSIVAEFSLILMILIISIILFFVIRRLFFYKGGWSNFEIDQAEIGAGNGRITFKPNINDQQIAYKIWVELSTRKIGLPIDLENDVIVEVYDSWHDFFSITRELIKDIPVSKVKKKSTQQIVNLSVTLLNDGLRPHLTLWQARFRHWYSEQLKEAKGDIEPQIIQSRYPKFNELKENMLVINKYLINYREKMYNLATGLSKDPMLKK